MTATVYILYYSATVSLSVLNLQSCYRCSNCLSNHYLMRFLTRFPFESLAGMDREQLALHRLHVHRLYGGHILGHQLHENQASVQLAFDTGRLVSRSGHLLRNRNHPMPAWVLAHTLQRRLHPVILQQLVQRRQSSGLLVLSLHLVQSGRTGRHRLHCAEETEAHQLALDPSRAHTMLLLLCLSRSAGHCPMDG